MVLLWKDPKQSIQLTRMVERDGNLNIHMHAQAHMALSALSSSLQFLLLLFIFFLTTIDHRNTHNTNSPQVCDPCHASAISLPYS